MLVALVAVLEFVGVFSWMATSRVLGDRYKFYHRFELVLYFVGVFLLLLLGAMVAYSLGVQRGE